MHMAKKTRFEKAREGMLRKLADPNDADDPRWIMGRLKRVAFAEAKSERATRHKEQQRMGKHKRRSREI
jgi:hypothetical protein